MVAHNPGTNDSLWWCAEQNLKGVTDIVTQYPVEYLHNFVQNIFQSSKLLIEYGGALAPFVLPALFESIFLLKLKHWIVLWSVLLLNVLLVSQAFVSEWFFLGWTVPITIVTVMFVLKYCDRIIGKYPILNQYHIRYLFLGFLIVVGFGLTFNRLTTFLVAEQTYPSLVEIGPVMQALKKHDPDIKSKIVMAIDPARAYYAGSKYLMTPLDYKGSIEDLVSFSGLDEQMKNYAPKCPSNMKESDLKANYLIYTKTPAAWLGEHDLSQFSFLFDPISAKIPKNFKLIYRSTQVVVYEID